MTAALSAQLAAALREFVRDIDALDPEADAAGSVEIRVRDGIRVDEGIRADHGIGAEEGVGPDGGTASVTLRAPVVRALVAALRSYHDPRDRGRCEHCGGHQLDDNFICARCGQASGLFGQLLRERVARHGAPAADRPDGD
jgi:hypothetical protein